MPTEVLSYYLKNENRRVRLKFQVVLQCAPFLKGLKVSCLISMDADLYPYLKDLFKGMSVTYHRLSCSEGKCLVLFYRPEELETYVNKAPARELIEQYGYRGMSLQQMLERLTGRVKECSEKGMEFPHEIGVFLGYPIEDVKGFIEKEGRESLMTGYWKVYSDPNGARMIFKEYDRAKECAVNEFLDGKSIREILEV